MARTPRRSIHRESTCRRTRAVPSWSARSSVGENLSASENSALLLPLRLIALLLPTTIRAGAFGHFQRNVGRSLAGPRTGGRRPGRLACDHGRTTALLTALVTGRGMNLPASFLLACAHYGSTTTRIPPSRASGIAGLVLGLTTYCRSPVSVSHGVTGAAYVASRLVSASVTARPARRWAAS